MPADIFGGRVHHNIRTQFQRPRQHRRSERAIDTQQGTVAVGQFGTGGNIGDRHARVAGAFNP